MINSTGIDFWVNTGIAIAATLGGIATGYAYIKKKITQNKNEHIIDISDPKDQKHTNIHELLTALRFQMDASRAQIAQFHNGGKFLEGSPMKRFSVSHESCGFGVSMEYPYMQAVLVTIFWDIVELLKENNAKIRLTKELNADSSLKIYNESKNIEAFAILPIKKEELFVGYVKVEWNDKNYTPNDPQDCERILEQYRSFIELELKRQNK
jgi:hypothetical protein